MFIQEGISNVPVAENPSVILEPGFDRWYNGITPSREIEGDIGSNPFLSFLV